MKTVAFYTLGCKVNQYETEAMSEIFSKNGYIVSSFDSVCDVYVINTCTVTNQADAKSRKMINRFRKTNPDSCIVAMGCFVETSTDDKKGKAS